MVICQYAAESLRIQSLPGLPLQSTLPFQKTLWLFVGDDLVIGNNEEGGECYMGEATLLAKDLWRLGHGRIQVVPTVNVAYGNETDLVKDLRGRVEDRLDMDSGELQTEIVEWQESPLSLVKCMKEIS